ncbi:MAG: WD40 repeat domain-containing protein [Ignavibacteria bacterium]|nr:WD40 repeat domain-containing protein [Ignavibacteria bacterium]
MKSIALATFFVLFCTLASAQLRITSPNGGEIFDSGTTVTLRWTGTAFPDSVTIEYSMDSGVTWTEIVRNWQQTTYQWLVPGTPSNTCLLRVTGPNRASPGGTIFLRDTTRPGTYSHNSIDLTNDGTLAVIADEDGFVTVFNAVTGEQITRRRVQGPTGSGARVVRAVLSSDETFVAALTESDSVVILRMPDLSILDRWETGIPKRVPLEDRWIATQPGGTRIAVSSFTHTRTYERNGVVVADVATLNTSSNTCVDWTPSGDRIVASSGAQGHVLADATTGGVIRSYPTPSFYGFVSPNGLYLASQSKNTQAVTIRDLATGTTVGTVPSGAGLLPFGIAWYPDNTIVRNAGPSGGRLERYAIDGTVIDTLTVQPFGFGSTTFNADGSVIGGASGGFSVVIRVAQPPMRDQDVSDAVWTIRSPIPADSALLSIDTVRTTSISNLSIPVRLSPRNATVLNGATSLDIDLSWNSTVAVPHGATPVGTSIAGIRRITIRVPVVPTQDDIVGELDLAAALGNDSTTMIRIDDVRGVVDPTMIKRFDGKLILTDLCQQGGVRLLNGDGTAAITARYVEPLLECNWTTIEDGVHEIHLCTTTGEQRTLWSGNVSHGDHFTSVDPGALSSGIYMILVRTPTMELHYPLMVIR